MDYLAETTFLEHWCHELRTQDDPARFKELLKSGVAPLGLARPGAMSAPIDKIRFLIRGVHGWATYWRNQLGDLMKFCTVIDAPLQQVLFGNFQSGRLGMPPKVASAGEMANKYVNGLLSPSADAVTRHSPTTLSGYDQMPIQMIWNSCREVLAATIEWVFGRLRQYSVVRGGRLPLAVEMSAVGLPLRNMDGMMYTSRLEPGELFVGSQFSMPRYFAGEMRCSLIEAVSILSGVVRDYVRRVDSPNKFDWTAFGGRLRTMREEDARLQNERHTRRVRRLTEEEREARLAEQEQRRLTRVEREEKRMQEFEEDMARLERKEAARVAREDAAIAAAEEGIEIVKPLTPWQRWAQNLTKEELAANNRDQLDRIAAIPMGEVRQDALGRWAAYQNKLEAFQRLMAQRGLAPEREVETDEEEEEEEEEPQPVRQYEPAVVVIEEEDPEDVTGGNGAADQAVFWQED